MALWLRFVVVAVASYLIGAIPWALIIGKTVYGIDPRKEGSGNLGATNVGRLMGSRAAIAVGALDVAKGFIAVAIGMLLVPIQTGNAQAWAEVLGALGAMLGHSYSPYVKFRGGKGIATAGGALLLMTPLVLPVEIIVFFGVTWLTSMVSAGSVTVAVLYPILTIIFYGNEPPFIVFSLVAATVVLWRHRTNIVRMYRGQERKIRWGRVKLPPPEETPARRASDGDHIAKG